MGQGGSGGVGHRNAKKRCRKVEKQEKSEHPVRQGFSLVELMVVIAVVALLLVMLIPAAMASRESARRATCASRLRQLGVALAAFESARGHFPAGRNLPDWVLRGQVLSAYSHYREVGRWDSVGESTGFRSVHVELLPHFDEQALYDRIDWSRPISTRMTTGRRPSNTNYQVFASPLPELLCPSDGARSVRPTDNNYRYNFGGSTPYAGSNSTRLQSAHDGQRRGLRVTGNGAFPAGDGLRAADFSDGLSRTVFLSERVRGSGRRGAVDAPTRADIVTAPERSQGIPDRDALFAACGRYRPAPSPFHFTSAGSWLDGAEYSNGWPFAGYASTLYNHVAPPNWVGYDCGSWSSIVDTPGEHAIVTARSGHVRLVNVQFGDGHGDSISDEVDLLVWRQLGARSDEADGVGP